jgi:hypothetical protein
VLSRPLLRDLTEFDAHHVVDRGWSSKRNGELLKLMVGDGFDAFLTVDQSIPFQQNLQASQIGVVLVSSRTNRIIELRPLLPQILDALRRVSPGKLRFRNLYPSATWYRSEVITQDGRRYFVLELLTPAIDTHIRNIMLGTSFRGRLLLVSFNVTRELEKNWLEVGRRMLSSVKVKE